MLATQMGPHKALGLVNRKMHSIRYIFWTEKQNLVINVVIQCFLQNFDYHLGSYCMQRTECRTILKT